MDDKVILLVEDNPDDEELVLRSLKRGNIGNQVIVARDGQAAVDLLLGAGKAALQPAVVLLDLHLPKLDGLEVLERVRADPRTRLLPVVILTSSDEDKDRIESYGLGANSYVCKPVDFDAFAKAVKDLGMYWLLLNRPANG